MRVAVVGLGSVGEACAHALVTSDVVRRLVLLNRTSDVADMLARDLRQARAWGRRLETEVGAPGDGRLLEGCDLVVLTLGSRLRGDQDRRALAAHTVGLYREAGIVDALRVIAEDDKTSVLVVTNPVEITVTWLAAETDIPNTRLFGLGTTVESARCSEHLARRLDVDAPSAWVHVLGEHGKGIVLPNRGRLEGLVEPSELERGINRARKRTLTDAALIRNTSERLGHARAYDVRKKMAELLGSMDAKAALDWLEEELSRRLAPPATRFAIAACVVEVARAIGSDSDRILTVSAMPPDRLELPPVALSLPYAVRQGGLGRCLLHEANEDLRKVAERLCETYQEIETG